jgi:hypothetical protein
MKTPGFAGVMIALCLVATGCGSKGTEEAAGTPPATAPAPLQIDRVEPGSIAIGVPFNVRRDGQAQLAVFGPSLPGGATVLWNDQPLDTSGAGAFVGAIVPAKLFDAPGTASIKLRAANGGISNAMEVTVYGKTGPAPKLTKLYPGTTTPGKGFNVQPNGQSALGVAGENFLPGATLICDGAKLTTSFGKGTGLSAFVPGALIASAGSHQVWAVNPDGKVSNKVEFKVGN